MMTGVKGPTGAETTKNGIRNEGGGGDRDPCRKKGGTSVPADIEDLIGKYAFGDVKKEPEKSPEKPTK